MDIAKIREVASRSWGQIKEKAQNQDWDKIREPVTRSWEELKEKARNQDWDKIRELGEQSLYQLKEKIKNQNQNFEKFLSTMETVSGDSRDDLLWWYRLRGTVLPRIWWKVGLIEIYTFAILFIHTFLFRLDFPQTLIPILGVVVGLLLGFRTNSAYDRYWEGRKLWTQITQEVRKLTRCIWAGVEEPMPKSVIEKKSALNLLLAFAIATKHYLREEYSDKYDDLQQLIAHLPRFSTAEQLRLASTDLTLSVGQGHVGKRGSPGTQLKAYECATPTNIPIEISYYILSYIKYVSVNDLAQGWAVASMQSSLSNLVDAFSNFERILRTPIPMAYSIHLHISVWLYILCLPFQLVGMVGWVVTLVVMGLGSFCLLGILSVAYEIENPFGYDENDLPLDDFCIALHAEMDMITGTRMVAAEDWMYSELNKPFAPTTMVGPKGLAYKNKEALLDILVKAKEQRCHPVVPDIDSEKTKDD